MYFAAFVDQTADKYIERDPAISGHLSTYSPERVLEVLETSGWVPLAVFPASPFQQTVFVCRKQGPVRASRSRQDCVGEPA